MLSKAYKSRDKLLRISQVLFMNKVIRHQTKVKNHRNYKRKPKLK